PGGVDDPVDDLPRGRDETADPAERLAQRADGDVDLAGYAHLLCQALATLAEYARRMRLIHAEQGVVALPERHQTRQVCDIAIHAEERIGHDDPPPGASRSGQQALELLVIAVSEDT